MGVGEFLFPAFTGMTQLVNNQAQRAAERDVRRVELLRTTLEENFGAIVPGDNSPENFQKQEFYDTAIRALQQGLQKIEGERTPLETAACSLALDITAARLEASRARTAMPSPENEETKVVNAVRQQFEELMDRDIPTLARRAVASGLPDNVKTSA